MKITELTPRQGEKSYQMVRDSRGQFVQKAGNEASLKKVRETSRQKGEPLERLDVVDGGFKCSECGEGIENRFSSGYNGKLLCWDCAMGEEKTVENGVSRTTDPAKVVLSDSALYHKSLCDYVINVATGCTHGCKFCYVPSTPNIRARQDMLQEEANVEDGQQEWGSYLLYRDDLPERLGRKLERKRTWKSTDRGRGVVMISSGTDCYQDRRTAQITRGCVIELAKQRIPVRILTRSPAVCRDLDLYKEISNLTDDGKLARVGSSIPCLDDEQTRAIEPGAPVPSARLNALQELSDAGVPVYVSMSPTYPTQDKEDLRNLLEKFAELDPEVVFHEPINPRGQNFDMTVSAAREAGQEELADELEKLKDRDHWVDYSIKQMNWVEELGEEIGVDTHIWPDKQVVKALRGEEKQKWANQIEAISPETIPETNIQA